MIKDVEPVSGVWIRRIGDYVQVLAEVDGEWRLLAKEHLESNFSHIVGTLGIRSAPKDPITKNEGTPER